MRTATVVLALVWILSAANRSAAQAYRYEVETGSFVGGVYRQNSGAASGGAIANGFFNDRTLATNAATVTADVPNGLYELWIGFRSPHGEKGYEFAVDGVTGSGMFPQSNGFSTDRAGLFNLTAGMNTMQVGAGWGYYEVDYFEFRPYQPPATLPVAPVLADEQASYRTRVLMNYLAQQYGHKTLAGQQHNQSQNLPFPEQSYLSKSGGLVPAVRGSDFIEYSPTRRQFNSNPRNETEQSIAWAQQTGGVVTMMWHWNAPDDLINAQNNPWWRGFYSDATNFDLPTALANPGGEKYQKLLRDIDAIAIELKKFQAADVPVLWRPLHEAQGGWFWWGEYGPGPFKNLWNLMYDRLTNHHQIHNLIWEFTSSAADGSFRDWYPGDDVVDMIGLDIYSTPGDTMSGQWLDVLAEYNGRKMIALSETGTWPDAAVMDQYGINWSYFSPWTGEFINNVPAEAMQATLGSEKIITLDELPTLPWKTGGDFLSADLDFNGVVDGEDLMRLLASFGVDARGDVDGDGATDGADVLWLQRQMKAGGQAGAATSAVPEPGGRCLIAAAVVASCVLRTARLGS